MDTTLALLPSWTAKTGLTLLVSTALTAPALAQATTFSVDPASPSNGAAACAGGTLRAGDVLHPATASFAPELAAPNPVCFAIRGGGGAGSLGLMLPDVADIDALSYADDLPLQQVIPPATVWFSVTRPARGAMLTYAKSVTTERAVGDSAASVFLDVGLPQIPIPIGVVGFHTEAIDGDGLVNAAGVTSPGFGLIEPELAGAGVDADDVDALDVDDTEAGFVLFSVDGLLPDPCTGLVGNGTGPMLGYPPAAVLASNLSGAPPIVWAPAAALGLDTNGIGTDDLDALAVWDNGNRMFDKPDVPLQWANGSADMVLFSVRASSWVVGQPDSASGTPIEPGDVLMPPVAGGLNNLPAILIPAEALGLATDRSGSSWLCNAMVMADDLNALDLVKGVQFDCNGNGEEDALEIFDGKVQDTNRNGIPDDCEEFPFLDVRPWAIRR